MSDTNTTAVIAKIRKLLALADSTRNSSEAEATAAALKVQELLQNHGLEMSQIEAGNGQSDNPLDQREKTKTDNLKAMYEWQKTLMAAIAKNSFVFHEVRRFNEPRTDKSGKTRHPVSSGSQQSSRWNHEEASQNK